jgi:hypothetical protein
MQGCVGVIMDVPCPALPCHADVVNEYMHIFQAAARKEAARKWVLG